MSWFDTIISRFRDNSDEPRSGDSYYFVVEDLDGEVVEVLDFYNELYQFAYDHDLDEYNVQKHWRD